MSASLSSQQIFQIPAPFLLEQDAESRLARGEPLKLTSLDLYDAQLFPGVSDRIAKELLEHRKEILEAAIEDTQKKCDALKIVKGIGKKKMEELCSMIDFQ